MTKRFATYMTECEVQMITNLVCDKLDLRHVRIDKISKVEEETLRCNGVYHSMQAGCPTISVINQGHLQLVLHELSHHYQENKTEFKNNCYDNSVHGATFTKGINAVTKSMKEIFGKERWPCTPAYIRSSSIKNVAHE